MLFQDHFTRCVLSVAPINEIVNTPNSDDSCVCVATPIDFPPARFIKPAELTFSQEVQSGPRVMPLTFTVGFILFLAFPVAFSMVLGCETVF